MTAQTPAEVAAAAARVAEEWTPQRVAAVRSLMFHDPWADDLESQCPDLALAANAIEALLADRERRIVEEERLRGLVAAAHVVRPKTIGATCSCGKWLVRTSTDMEATEAHAAHVADVLNGVSG